VRAAEARFASFLLGRVGEEGMIPSEWVAKAVGGNSLRSNFLTSLAGAFIYFATLTEVPIIQGLMGSGMGKGPALAGTFSEVVQRYLNWNEKSKSSRGN